MKNIVCHNCKIDWALASNCVYFCFSHKRCWLIWMIADCTRVEDEGMLTRTLGENGGRNKEGLGAYESGKWQPLDHVLQDRSMESMRSI